MASVWGSPYKMQFFPKFESQVSQAMLFHIPLISGKFVQDCIDQKKMLNVDQYLVFGGEAKTVDTESRLHPKVQELIKILFDKTAQHQAILQLHLDSTKIMSVNKEHISRAYTILSDIERQIPLKKNKKTQVEATRKIAELSERFYKTIPHTTSTPIDSDSVLKEKLSMLEALADIEVANKLMNEGAKVGIYNVNPIDINYKKLKTKILPLERYSQEYDLIIDAIKNCRAADHDYFDIEIEDIFEIEREGEKEKFEKFSNMKHQRLLWHGSRLANYIGILSQGLRIAPPEAPVTGYFLGKGVYFADIVSKSAEFCNPTPQNPTALLLLSQVAVGRSYQISHTKFVSKEDIDEAGYYSVKGCGTLAPDPAYDQQLSDGTVISIGKEIPSGVIHSELRHNEYVVYDTDQVLMKYLIKVKLSSKTGKEIKASSLVDANY